MLLFKTKSQQNILTISKQCKQTNQERISFGSLLKENMSQSSNPMKFKQLPKSKFLTSKALFIRDEKQNSLLIKSKRPLIQSNQVYLKPEDNKTTKTNQLFTEMIKSRQEVHQKEHVKNPCMFSRQTADSEYWSGGNSHQTSKSRRQSKTKSNTFQNSKLIRDKSNKKYQLSIKQSEYFSFLQQKKTKNDQYELETETDFVNTSKASINFDMNPYL